MLRASPFHDYIIHPAVIPLPPDENIVGRAAYSHFPWLVSKPPFLVSFFGRDPWDVQGWKLHVSATAQNATTVLDAIAPIIKRYGVRFKMIDSLENLFELNSGNLGFAQIGKFVTLYPSSAMNIVALAEELDVATRGMRGPVVPTDHPLYPHSLVSYRYGAFRQPTDFASSSESYFDDHGRLTPDYRLPFYFENGSQSCPFEKQMARTEEDRQIRPLLDRFVVLRSLHRSGWGRVYDVIDLDAKPPIRCIVKEYWHDVALDIYGRDSRDHAALEATLLYQLRDTQISPQLLDHLEVDGNLYLILEYIPGRTLVQHFKLGYRDRVQVPYATLLQFAITLAEIVARLHQQGVIHRDLKPGNILITEDGSLRLIDFAFSYRPGIDSGPPMGFGTEGFSAGGEEEREPAFCGDIYSWAAIIHSIATDYFHGSTESNRFEFLQRPALGELRPDLPLAFTQFVDRALSHGRQVRPYNFSEVLVFLRERLQENDEMPHRPRTHASAPHQNICTEAAMDYYTLALQTAKAIAGVADYPHSDSVCWTTSPETSTAKARPANLYSGAAGIALFMAAAANVTGDAHFCTIAKAAARWLAGEEWACGSTNIGLYGGEAGVGLFYLRMATLLDEPAYVHMAAMRAQRLLDITPKTVDLVDGSAGLLIFLLELSNEELSNEIHEEWLHTRIHTLANKLMATARYTPENILYWDVPSIMPNLPAQKYCGLLHGAAGIALALLSYAIRFDDARALSMAHEVGLGLVRSARHRDTSAGIAYQWPRTFDVEEDDEFMAAHCHGAGGIGQFLIRLWMQKPTDELLSAARGAALEVSMRDPNHPSQCHGWSGDGEMYLDFYEATADPSYLEMAQGAAAQLQRFRRANQPGQWNRQGNGDFCVDYMTGAAGIGSFLLRLARPTMRHEMILPWVMRYQRQAQPQEQRRA